MIILMGVAGAGKSLQGKMFVDDLGYHWVSSGELFRSQLSEARKKELLSGKLVSDDEVIELTANTLREINDSDHVVLDGVPRTITQADWILDQIKQGKLNVQAVFNLNISKDVVKKRLLDRGRSDDNEQGIDARFNVYETKTIPIIDYFRENNVKVFDINADQSPETVHQEMLKHIS